MPVAGRKPKPDGQKRNRVKPVHDWTEVVDVPYAGPVPSLPRRRGGWSARTKRKWAAWSSMPHCVLWGPAEWDFALDALELAAQFHDGNERVATELRNREKILGTTRDFLRDLRIRYVSDDPETGDGDASVTAIDEYRQMLRDGDG
jgi:hypothetical protein